MSEILIPLNILKECEKFQVGGWGMPHIVVSKERDSIKCKRWFHGIWEPCDLDPDTEVARIS